MVEIPQSIITKFQTVMDRFLEDIPIMGTLLFEPTTTTDSNIDGNYTLSGRPEPFYDFPNSDGSSDANRRQVEVTAQIKMRVYWNEKSWYKQGNIITPNTVIQTKFYTSDLSKVLRCIALRFDSITDLDAHLRYVFELDGEPIPIGFDQDRYMIASWKRASGN